MKENNKANHYLFCLIGKASKISSPSLYFKVVIGTRFRHCPMIPASMVVKLQPGNCWSSGMAWQGEESSRNGWDITDHDGVEFYQAGQASKSQGLKRVCPAWALACLLSLSSHKWLWSEWPLQGLEISRGLWAQLSKLGIKDCAPRSSGKVGYTSSK